MCSVLKRVISSAILSLVLMLGLFIPLDNYSSGLKNSIYISSKSRLFNFYDDLQSCIWNILVKYPKKNTMSCILEFMIPGYLLVTSRTVKLHNCRKNVVEVKSKF